MDRKKRSVKKKVKNLKILGTKKSLTKFSKLMDLADQKAKNQAYLTDGERAIFKAGFVTGYAHGVTYFVTKIR